MADSFKKHGAVFTVPLFHRRVTFLIGPEVSPHFYKARTAGCARSTRAAARDAGPQPHASRIGAERASRRVAERRSG